MIVSIITLFPEVFRPLLESSILAKAQKQKRLRINLINLRGFGLGTHRQVDDRVYGGGVGMVLRVEPIAAAIAKLKIKDKRLKIVLLTPQGKTFNQKMARQLSKEKHLVLVCGKYEGVDERVRKLVDEEISIGDYVLSGGEPAAMVVIDAVSRLLPGVLTKEATKRESFAQLAMTRSEIATHVRRDDHQQLTILEPPQYTRPEVFRGMKVPKILLSGNHQKIAKWRQEQALKKTRKLRPDLLKEL